LCSAENVRAYHAHIRENDICTTYTLVNPQVDWITEGRQTKRRPGHTEAEGVRLGLLAGGEVDRRQDQEVVRIGAQGRNHPRAADDDPGVGFLDDLRCEILILLFDRLRAPACYNRARGTNPRGKRRDRNEPPNATIDCRGDEGCRRLRHGDPACLGWSGIGPADTDPRDRGARYGRRFGWLVAMIGCDSGYVSAFLDRDVAREMYPDWLVATGAAATTTGEHGEYRAATG
jgi:hypothetical protein